MDRPQERVLQALPDPDRVATMYGELGNKLVRWMPFAPLYL